MNVFRRGVPDLGPVTVGGVTLRNPVMTASGTAGHDTELAHRMDLAGLGAVVVKSLHVDPWPGNPAPRVHVAGNGMLNAVGLEGPGAAVWCNDSLPRLEAVGATVVASIWGRSIEEYAAAARALSSVGSRIAAVEVNLSCPNLEGRNSIFAHDAELSARVVSAVCNEVGVPVWAKLSANTDRVVAVAEAVAGAGAPAVTLINTMLGLQVDTASARPVLGNGGGGLSGPPIHAVAVRAVHDVAREIPSLDIIGVGGVSCGADAVEMIMVGAKAVQVGTATFARPDACARVLRQAAVLLDRRGARTWHSVHRLAIAG